MTRQLRNYTLWRFICGVLGGLIIPTLLIYIREGVPFIGTVILSCFMLGFLVAGELLERYLFFRAVVPLKMPGAGASS